MGVITLSVIAAALVGLMPAGGAGKASCPRLGVYAHTTPQVYAASGALGEGEGRLRARLHLRLEVEEHPPARPVRPLGETLRL